MSETLTTTEANKAVVRRFIEEVMNRARVEVLDELYTPTMAAAAKRRIAPFREAFPDFEMEIVDLIAEGDKVVGRFLCSGTHRGEWRSYPATGRRFEQIDEVYIFTFTDGRVARTWGLEGTAARMKQLGQSRLD